MTNTTNIDVDDTGWTKIAGTGDAISGYFTIAGGSPIQFVQATSAPADTLVGHWLEPASDEVGFTLTANESVYARAESNLKATIIITLDG